ncbi:MAG: MerR family transcriptional regulator [Lachnospiraceae bacterium]|nr:MerR family transcriptional regulator [Lachnospiraceae bacterium]
MKDYLSIGKVSKLKNVSIKSLRYYDRIGVFVPAYINKDTGYRYYTQDQLYLLDAIQLCIELGIPLSSFSDYRESDGSLNIQKLLFDGKDMAEKKIKAMRDCIDQLQSTLRKLESEEMPKKAEPAPGNEKDLAERSVILVEFDEVTTADRYNHMLLSLFVNAERMGLGAGYPTGLFYETKGGKTTKYVFATLNSEIKGRDDLPDNLRILPGGRYDTSRSLKHRIEKADEVFEVLRDETSSEKDHILIETDVMDGSEKGTKELQLLFV